jgi:hypothetical protein
MKEIYASERGERAERAGRRGGEIGRRRRRRQKNGERRHGGVEGSRGLKAAVVA